MWCRRAAVGAVGVAWAARRSLHGGASAAEPEQPRVYRVCLTGGPCGGKSAALANLRRELEEKGYNVFTVPEAATMIFEGGGRKLFTAGESGCHHFQLELLRMQLVHEDSFISMARACGKKAVVLIDRGTMDGRVFCTPGQWESIMEEGGWTTAALRDQRYDLVLLFSTTAWGAEHIYEVQRSNNPERTETAEEARAQEKKLREVYLGHPHVRILENKDSSWNQKLARARRAVLDLTGDKGAFGAYKKYRILNPPEAEEFPCTYETVETTVHILRGSTPEREVRLYKRRSESSTLYMRQVMERDSTTGETTRTENTLGMHAYRAMLEQVDPNHYEVKKRSLCFEDDGQYFELARFLYPPSATGAFLYTEMQYADAESGKRRNPRLPAWILKRGSVVDVTEDLGMSHYALSRKPAAGA
eukprot:TRINITY_DN50352_c0_g1_i1.p1 TRINITY_DN50352_c0_g1~~TRINITY_DN50352_c0_g1_i1.p1  ORF type:complete len:451 (+),score=165.92 TRINITY_DN50352_c0_g1_i1:104-1354(+)